MYRETSDASDLNERGSHQRSMRRAGHVTRWETGFKLNNCLARLGKFNMMRIAPGGLREDQARYDTRERKITWSFKHQQRKGSARCSAGAFLSNQASAEALSPSLLLRKKYSEPYNPAEPMVARVKPTATGCRGAASDFFAFSTRKIRDQARNRHRPGSPGH